MSKNAQEWIAQPPVAEKDFVSTLIYTDQNLFEEEIKKIKKSTWKFACHESEIPEDTRLPNIKSCRYSSNNNTQQR